MKDFGTTLATLRKEKHLRQPDLAGKISDLGIPTKASMVSKWEKNVSSPNIHQFAALCEVLEISDINETFDIFNGNNRYVNLNEEGKKKAMEYIELLDRSGMYERKSAEIIPFTRKIRIPDLPASAGTGQLLDSEHYTEIEVGPEVPEETDFGIRIAGDSMEPRYVNGQIVFVKAQETLEPGEIGIFLYDNETYIKKLGKTAQGLQLISLNKNYPPIEVADEIGLKIFGKVIS